MVGVLPWYLYRYDTYLITAACSEEYVGIATGVIGYIRYISPALPGVILALQMESLIVALSLVICAISVVFSVSYVVVFKGEFLEFQHAKEVQ